MPRGHVRPSKYNRLVAFENDWYLFNAFRRGLHRVTPSVVTALDELGRGNPDWDIDLSDAILAELTSSGYVIDEAMDEDEEIARQVQEQKDDVSSISLTIAPTMKCNFGCPYCYEGQDKDERPMDDDTINALVRFAAGLYRDDCRELRVTWFGGEPLLGLPQMESLTHKLLREVVEPHGLAYHASIITNGYGLTRKVAERLRGMQVSFTQITLDGMAVDHDRRRFLRIGRKPTFHQIVDNIKESCDVLNIAVRVNLDKTNQESFLPLVEFLRNEGIHPLHVYPSPMRDHGDQKMDSAYCSLDEFVAVKNVLADEEASLAEDFFPYPIARRMWCGAQHDMAWVIAANGDLHKCWDTINNPSQAVGSVWEGTDSSKLDFWKHWGPFSQPKCEGCKLLPLCMAGCPAMAQRAGGLPQCEQSGAEVESALRTFVRLHRDQGQPARRLGDAKLTPGVEVEKRR